MMKLILDKLRKRETKLFVIKLSYLYASRNAFVILNIFLKGFRMTKNCEKC